MMKGCPIVPEIDSAWSRSVITPAGSPFGCYQGSNLYFSVHYVPSCGKGCHWRVTPCHEEASPQGMTTTRLQRRHFSSTPSARTRARRLPHKQRLSRVDRTGRGRSLFIHLGEIENHFQFQLSSAGPPSEEQDAIYKFAVMSEIFTP